MVGRRGDGWHRASAGSLIGSCGREVRRSWRRQGGDPNDDDQARSARQVDAAASPPGGRRLSSSSCSARRGTVGSDASAAQPTSRGGQQRRREGLGSLLQLVPQPLMRKKSAASRFGLRSLSPMSDSERDGDNERRESGKSASPSRGDSSAPRKQGKKALRKIAAKLFDAAELDDVKRLKKIVEKKYKDVDGLLSMTDEKGRTAVHLAARCARCGLPPALNSSLAFAARPII